MERLQTPLGELEICIDGVPVNHRAEPSARCTDLVRRGSHRDFAGGAPRRTTVKEETPCWN